MTGRTTNLPSSRRFKRLHRPYSEPEGGQSLRFLYVREFPSLPETRFPCSRYTMGSSLGTSGSCFLPAVAKTEEGKLSSVDCGARANPKAGWPSLPGGGPVALPGRDGLSRGVWHFPAIPACRKYFLPPFSASGSYRNSPVWYTSVAVRNPSRVNPPNCARANHQVPASRLATVTVPMQGRAIRQNIMMLMPWRGV